MNDEALNNLKCGKCGSVADWTVTEKRTKQRREFEIECFHCGNYASDADTLQEAIDEWRGVA